MEGVELLIFFLGEKIKAWLIRELYNIEFIGERREQKYK
jgi:hypothetical protein